MIVEFHKALPQQEAYKRLVSGWIVISGVSLGGPQIAVPGQPPGVTGQMDVWILPQAMIPQEIVMKALAGAAEVENGLDWMSQYIFGVDVKEVQEALARAEAQRPKPKKGTDPKELLH